MLREIEREHYATKREIPQYFREHRVIGPMIVEAESAWRETRSHFISLKARQEILLEKFFPKSIFIPRRVIPALNQGEVEATIIDTARMPKTFVGVRTAYSDPRLGTAPWGMQNASETPDGFVERAIKDYRKWISKDQTHIPEAIIVMQNPEYLGDPSLAMRCFVFRFMLREESSTCFFEGRAWTDQMRSLEETIEVNGKRVPNPDFDPKKIFRGELPFECTPYNVKTGNIIWDERSVPWSDSATKDLLFSIAYYLKENFNLNDIVARLIALSYITNHIVIKFQGRLSQGQEDSLPIFDFLSGYDVGGAEEKSLITGNWE